MVDFFRSFYVNYVCLYCTLGAFSLSLLPVHAAQVTVNDVAFALKMEKLVEKIKKYADNQDRSKLFHTMFDIKQEAEGYLGQKIDLDAIMDQKIKQWIKRKVRERSAPHGIRS